MKRKKKQYSVVRTHYINYYGQMLIDFLRHYTCTGTHKSKFIKHYIDILLAEVLRALIFHNLCGLFKPMGHVFPPEFQVVLLLVVVLCFLFIQTY